MVVTTTGSLFREILAELEPETMLVVWLRTLFLRQVVSKMRSHG